MAGASINLHMVTFTSVISLVTGLVAASLTSLVLSSSPADAAQRPSASFEKGVLTVSGTAKGQRITVVRDGKRVIVRVGGAKVPLPKRYRNSKCDEIRILGLAGDDRMTVDSSKGTLPDVVLVGGKGDDTLTGGTRSDVLDGGQGDDELRPGGGGRDVLKGGVGADTYLIDADLPGQASIAEPDADGPDHLTFASTSREITVNLGSPARQRVSSAYAVVLTHLGIEELTGGDGDDNLVGGDEPDRIHGGPGDDVLSRPWTVYGGEGNEWFGDAGDDTFMFSVSCAGSCPLRTTRIEDSSGNDTVSFAVSGGFVTLDLRLSTWQAVSSSYDLQLGSGSTFENIVGGGSNELIGNDLANRLAGGVQSDTLTGNGGADTFVSSASPFNYATALDTITDFAAGIDTVDLEGLTIKAGLGTSTVTVWDGVNDQGSITASNGHLWTAEDFS